MRADIVPGAIFPDYELPDHHGSRRKLSELQGGDPLVLVLSRGGFCPIYKIYNGYWFFGRPTVEELRLDLRAVLQRCRPDWDISSAAQRTAWANGEKVGFYPYGRDSGAGVGRTGLIWWNHEHRNHQPSYTTRTGTARTNRSRDRRLRRHRVRNGPTRWQQKPNKSLF
jgi:hypothetical protein